MAAAKRALKAARDWFAPSARTPPLSTTQPLPLAGGTPRERATRLEQKLQEFLDTLGPEHHRSVAARNNLGASYAQMGRTEAAVTQFEQALGHAHGKADDQFDVIAENLAYCYEDALRFDDAAELWERLVQRRSEDAGAGASETVRARASLAAAYRRRGRLDAAVAHAERAVEDAEGVGGEQRESLGVGLARAYREAGSLDAAARQLRMVLAQRRQRLGAVHGETLALRHRLGQWQREAGRDSEAVTTLREAYRDALSASGDPEIRLLALRIRRDLARAYRAAGIEGAPAELH